MQRVCRRKALAVCFEGARIEEQLHPLFCREAVVVGAARAYPVCKRFSELRFATTIAAAKNTRTERALLVALNTRTFACEPVV
jgi:hypothetical protein